MLICFVLAFRPLGRVQKAVEAREILIPIRIDLDTDTHRIRDCFMWNLNGAPYSPPLSFIATNILSLLRGHSHPRDVCSYLLSRPRAAHDPLRRASRRGNQSTARRTWGRRSF